MSCLNQITLPTTNYLSGSDAAEWNYQEHTGLDEQIIGDKDLAKPKPCWTNEGIDKNKMGTFLIMVYLQSTYKRTQSRLIAGYTGKIYNDQTLKQFYLKTTPHTQTKINPGVLQRTPTAREGGELRSQFFGVPARWREGMLYGAAPASGRAARPTATRAETVSAKEPGWSRAESETGIRAADRTHERPGQDQVPLNQRNRWATKARRGQTLRVTTLLSLQPATPTVSLQPLSRSNAVSLQPQTPATTADPHRILSTLSGWCHNLSPSQVLFAAYGSLPARRGLGEADATVHPDWTELPWVCPFWAGFWPCGEKPPPPPRVSGLIKNKPQHKDFALANGPLDTAGGQWIVMGDEI
uniref:Uncharacterized protein n=1 Tax=Eptatretus burgeri TaxID=7764 RepID=A0A8C4PWG9_EPTBU